MRSFKDYLVEEISHQQDGIADVSDLLFTHGNDGVGHSATVLNDIHDHLLGKKIKAELIVPMQGHPRIEFGIKKGKFVASKVSSLLKEEKEDYLQHLQKIMPRDGGAFGGVVIHDKFSLSRKNNMLSATPKNVTYSVSPDSAEGKKMKNSHLGVVLDRKFTNGKAEFLTEEDRKKFKDHPDVHNIDPHLVSNPNNYTPEEQNQFLSHFKNAHISYTKMKPEALEEIEPHSKHIVNHMEAMRKSGGIPDAETYIAALSMHQKKALEKSLPSKKDKINQDYADQIQHAHDKKQHIDSAIKLSNHLHAAKSVLLGVAAKNNPYMHSIKGKAVEPSGITHIDENGNKVKISR